MIVREKRIRVKNSGGPKDKAKDASQPANRISDRFDIRSAVHDAQSAMPRARPASPFSAIGYPSRIVADEAGVPGVLMRTAGIDPPKIPPLYTPRRSKMPVMGCIENVNGNVKATAMVADMPGIAPPMTPTTMPMAKAINASMLPTKANPAARLSRKLMATAQTDPAGWLRPQHAQKMHRGREGLPPHRGEQLSGAAS